MTKFMYNNIKNASHNHMFFNLNSSFYHCVSFEKDIDLIFKSILANELLLEL